MLRSIDILNDRFNGVVEFRQETEGRWQMEYLESYKPGTGKELVRRFCAEVGKNQEVEGSIIEPVTRRQLSRMGVFSAAKEDGQTTLTDPIKLRRLKLVRVLEGGGLHVEQITVKSVDREQGVMYQYEVKFEGRVR